MTLIVEDGTGKADAEGLITVAFFRTYHAARGNTAAAALTDAEVEADIRLATDYMGEVYALRWSGYRVSDTQATDFPRYEMPRRDLGACNAYYPSDMLPVQVKNACAILAWKAVAATNGLTPDIGQAVKRKKAGSVEIEYQDYSTATKTYRQIDNLLAPFLANSGGIRVVRA